MFLNHLRQKADTKVEKYWKLRNGLCEDIDYKLDAYFFKGNAEHIILKSIETARDHFPNCPWEDNLKSITGDRYKDHVEEFFVIMDQKEDHSFSNLLQFVFGKIFQHIMEFDGHMWLEEVEKPIFV